MATHRLLDAAQPPDAVFAMVDLMGIGAVLAARDRGVPVPKGLAVVGFGNEDASAWIDPPLTTVEQYPHEIGIEAVRHLLEQIETDDTPNRTHMMRTKLIVRGST